MCCFYKGPTPRSHTVGISRAVTAWCCFPRSHVVLFCTLLSILRVIAVVCNSQPPMQEQGLVLRLLQNDSGSSLLSQWWRHFTAWHPRTAMISWITFKPSLQVLCVHPSFSCGANKQEEKKKKTHKPARTRVNKGAGRSGTVARQLCFDESKLKATWAETDDARNQWKCLRSLIYVLVGKTHQFRVLPDGILWRPLPLIMCWGSRKSSFFDAEKKTYTLLLFLLRNVGGGQLMNGGRVGEIF